MANFGISPEWKEELKSRSDIVSTISRYIKLERKGKTFWGLCPFHYEKTPSFSVNDNDQYYKCFGCGESGDVISFVEKYEGVDFMEACKILAKNAGMEMPEFEKNSDIAKQKAEKDQILQVLRQAAIFYRECLNGPRGKPGRDYLERRGVDARSITVFGIGYSPDFSLVVTELSKQGFSTEIMKKAGVVDISARGPFDAYGERLVFPLINTYGDVVGFSARLIEDKPFAKYKNTAQTMVFDKSRVIFGINLIKKLRTDLKGDVPNVILVEGQLDVISMHQSGFNNTVACLGTAVTPMHAKELKRMTDNVILLFDGDSAGQKAALRSIEILKPVGLSVKVATLPEKSDPDDLLKTQGKEVLQALLDSAIEAVDFQLRTLAAGFDLGSNEQRAKFIKAALVIIGAMDSEAEKNIYLETVKKLTSVPVDVLRQDLNKTQVETTRTEATPESKNQGPDAFIQADLFVLASLLHRKPWANIAECDGVEFIAPDFKLLFEYIKTGTPEKPALVSGVFDRIAVDQSPSVSEIINYNFSSNKEDNELTWQHCLGKNMERKLYNRKDELERAFATSDLEKRKQFAKEIFELDREIAKLKKKIKSPGQRG